METPELRAPAYIRYIDSLRALQGLISGQSEAEAGPQRWDSENGIALPSECAAPSRTWNAEDGTWSGAGESMDD